MKSSNAAVASTPSANKNCFLRRLVDMLSENQDVISFTSGSIDKKGNVTLGKVEVHDRIKVENDVLPKYFNHSSFASLRRQLNYFNFQREGKGRQKGATYTNEQVVFLEDILKLRRRPTATPTTLAVQVTDGSANGSGDENGSNASSKSVTTVSKKRRASKLQSSIAKKGRKTTTALMQMEMAMTDFSSPEPKVVSPRSSPSHSSTPVLIALDLTIPAIKTSAAAFDTASSDRHFTLVPDEEFVGDEDVLAGCQALLSLTHGRDYALSA